mmetsp:Transcript_26724/g.63365  ORF Transcript_26724/g.63365 Transcript_26724/m.63365 type:complete len:292 (+) Transcript_26724:362-1237(+)
MGENVLSHEGHKNSLRYRENTLKSFLQVLHKGATFVEFDVQVTRDGIPVIFHDDVVEWGNSENFSSRHISQINLAEFQALGTSAEPLLRKVRDSQLQWTEERQAWSCAEEDQLPTLELVLQHLPDDAGIDLEVKMTTPPGTVTSSAEIDRVIEPILKVVDNYPRKAPLAFSSFDPEVCVALKKRQREHPVLYLSSCSKGHPDSRQRTVDAAVDFALAQGLAGVVLNTEYLYQNQHTVSLVKQKGLYLATYGRSNSKIEWVCKQITAGVDAIITDDICAANQAACDKHYASF